MNAGRFRPGGSAVYPPGMTTRLRSLGRLAAFTIALAVSSLPPGPAGAAGASEPARQARLPGGGVATAARGDVAKAWYARPTGRYAHGVLGDAIEGGSLVVVARDGGTHEVVLHDRYVFEDLTPRIADLDGDGRSEIVTIRSSSSGGAALAIYGLVAGKLVERAATREIGRANRWLSVAGIDRYRRGAGLLIAYVETPHIGGTLKYAAFAGGRLSVRTILAGQVSNHRIGSTLLSMSASADVDADGIVDLALPSADRRSLVVVSDGRARLYPVDGQIDGPIRHAAGSFVTRDERGRRVLVSP